MSSISKVLCLPGYLQSGSTLARKSSGLRKILSKKLNIQVDYLTPCHEIKSRHELSFPLGPTDEESDKVWTQIVENGSNARWFDAQSANNYVGLDDAIKFIIDHIDKNGPYDGIIGFSQGAAMAAMITNCLQKFLPTHPPLKISLIVSGFCLTVPRNDDHSAENKQRILEITDLDQYANEVKISEKAAKYLCDAKGESMGKHLPTEVILLYGLNDSIVPPIRSEYVSTLYNAKQVHNFAHDGGHFFPNDKKIVQPIAELFDRKVNANSSLPPKPPHVAKEQEMKRRRVDNGANLEGFSRREYTPAAKPASAYGDIKQKPAWLKNDEKKNLKYEMYGQRSDVVSTSYVRRLTESSNSVTTYKQKHEEQDSRLNRLKRARETVERQVPPRRDETPDDEEKEEEQEDDDESVQPYLHLDVANPSSTRARSNDSYHTFHSRIKDKENRDINSIVRQHYNQRTQQSKRQGPRTSSPIYKLRNFNNTIKYILIGNWAKHDTGSSPLFSVLDLCCGKGGDLNKCEFIKIDQYIGIDISDLSVREAFDRYSKQKARFRPRNGTRVENRYNFQACFATGDCFTQYVPDILEPNFPGIIEKTFPVDTVSTQFALHYAFESEDKVNTLLTNVSKSLRVGGRFIGTIPSSDFIKSKIVDKQYFKDAKTGKVKFGNGLYSVTFDKEPPEDGVFRPPFGNRYSYWLKDAVDDVPEYVVPFEILRAMCEEHNLMLKYKKNFIDIFNQEIPNYFAKLNKNLIDGLKRNDGKYGAEGEEKEAVGFYIGFVFEKVG